MKKAIVCLLVVVLMFSLVACSNNAQNAKTESEPKKEELKYPEKPINVIVAYKAGGGTDVGARILCSEAEKILGQPLVIINKPGADGELGYTELCKSPPDGYTIGFINLPTFVNLYLERKTEFDKNSITPILNHVYDPGVLVVKSNSPFETLEQFVDYAKAHPEEITISNNGTGASNHIGAAHFAKLADIKVTHVPFGGSADMLAALRGDHVMATVAKISEVAALVKNGELRILASYTEERLEDFPDVPTMREKGYDVLFGSARALVGPKGIPQEIADKLHDSFKKALESPSHIEKAKNADLPIKYMSPQELMDYIEKEEAYLKEIVPQLDLN
ncbi:tripartite tricarboxylate transporter substrate binding protein [Tepidanaerobacter acetatoxydans]|uniref:tripartite tricarboxylate transporter substrate binding protein n=1 Tax=Tepidanaerobacter acetatoxydans TaxID=499229 RepID=UPI0026E9BE74|nr:tripartite tricarboxylate transporter substrate-binding protein [Tepidanaerobacter acetatoxydans]